MAWAADMFRLIFPALLSLCLGSACGGAHTLSYDFTINSEPRPGQPRCEVQAEVDGKHFLDYDCSRDEVKSISPLGTLVNATKTWKEQTDTLSDVGDLLRGQLDNIREDIHISKVPFSLQGRMICQREASGVTHGSWQFGVNKEKFLFYDSEKGDWTVVHPDGMAIRERWKSDRAVTNFFEKIAMGDCKSWLDLFLVTWEKVLETPATTATPSSATQIEVTNMAWVLSITLVIHFRGI